MRRTTLTVIVLVLVLAIMAFAAVPAFAANPSAAAQPSLHTAHCATMGVPGAGHTAIPYECSMSADACAGMTM